MIKILNMCLDRVPFVKPFDMELYRRELIDHQIRH